MRLTTPCFLGACIMWSQPAWCQLACTATSPLIVDDFQSGQHTVTLRTDSEEVFQSGTMVGGARRTTFAVADNPLNQPGTFSINDPAGLLMVSMGPRVNWGLGIIYGLVPIGPNPLNLDLTGCDRFRLTVDSTDIGFVLIMNVYTGSFTNFKQATVSIPPSGQIDPFAVDIPFESFQGPDTVDFAHIDFISLDLRTGGPVAGDDLTIASIRALSQ
jgi:hypothetical protein